MNNNSVSGVDKTTQVVPTAREFYADVFRSMGYSPEVAEVGGEWFANGTPEPIPPILRKAVKESKEGDK